MTAHRRSVDDGASASGHPGHSGFTLVEVLVALLLTGLLASGAAMVVRSSYRVTTDTVVHADGSSSALQTAARFAQDVAGARGIGSVPAVSRAAPGCGADPASLVRFVSAGADGALAVTSYHRTAARVLLRRTCAGVDLAAALAAEPMQLKVVRNLAPATSSTEVACRATEAAPVAPATTAGDAQCRIVTLTVTAAGGYTFAVRGIRAAGDGSIGSGPVLRSCTLLASDNANVYEDQPGRNFNDRDDYGEAAGGRTYIEDRTRSGKIIRGYLRFNLSSACEGVSRGEPPFMPPGKALTGATLRLVYRNATQNTSNQECDGQHTLDPVAIPWDPTTLTWDTSPLVTNPTAAVRDLRLDISTRASWEYEPITLDVLPVVRHWYPSSDGGDWDNNGWVISSVSNSCDDHESHKFQSKGSNNATSPRLVLTW